MMMLRKKKKTVTMMMSDLSDDLVEEILSRVPLISLGAVKSTCKLWNNLSKDRVLFIAQARQQFLGFMMTGYKFRSFRFDLHGIQNEDVEYFVEPSINQIDKLNQVKISQIFHCDGLLLLVTGEEDNTRLVVWNPYLAQTRLIQPRDSCDLYALGYDNTRNHKILRVAEDYGIYDLMSNSWRDIDVIPDYSYIKGMEANVSLKGNTYFIIRGQIMRGQPEVATELEKCLICFDFSRERFGRCLPLPFDFEKNYDTVVLSSTREGEEQLSVLYNRWNTNEIKIWVTTKIEPNSVSWSIFLTSDVTPFDFYSFRGSFFIEQEKKLAVLFDIRRCNIACIIGENGYLRAVVLRETPPHTRDYPPDIQYCYTQLCFYAPSLVQISQELELSPF